MLDFVTQTDVLNVLFATELTNLTVTWNTCPMALFQSLEVQGGGYVYAWNHIKIY